MTRLVRHSSRSLWIFASLILITVIAASNAICADDPPVRCTGYGNFQSISLTDWGAGLGSWSVGTHGIASDFDTSHWAVVGNLPNSRPGLAAFVVDQNNGDCAAEDKSGALTLDSPQIVIP